MLLWTFAYMCFAFSFVRYLSLGEELLSHEAALSLIFWGTAKLFSKIAAHFTFPLTVCFLISPHPLHTCYYLSFNFNNPDGCKVTLVLISLMMNDVEHHFISLLAICVSSLYNRMSVKSFTQFSFSLFVFLLLCCKSSLYILDTSPLLDTRFANISSHYVRCLFWWSPWKHRTLDFDKIQLIFYSVVCAFGVLRNHCLTQGHEDAPLCFLIRVAVWALTFKFLIHLGCFLYNRK